MVHIHDGSLATMDGIGQGSCATIAAVGQHWYGQDMLGLQG
jgi:hypothetical protein